MPLPDLFQMFRQGAGQNTPQGAAGSGSTSSRAGTNPDPNNQPRGNPDPNNPNPNPDPNNPNPDPNDPTKQQNKSPLADFADLWQTPKLKEGEAPPPNWDDASSIVPSMNVDPKKLYEAAQRIDFSKVMPREKVEAALKGDAQAFGEVINAVAHHAYANMAMSSSRVTEAMIKQMAPKILEALPHHIRKHVVADTVNADNPIFNDPAVAPVLESVRQQMQIKYPTASAREISEKAKKYVSDFAAAIKDSSGRTQQQQNNPSSRKALDKTGTGAEDWVDFFAPNTQQ